MDGPLPARLLVLRADSSQREKDDERAETDHYFKNRAELGALGKFIHDREPTPIDRQPIIRMNRDTPCSAAIFDLTIPVNGKASSEGEKTWSARL
jgi:hypothetical protein